MAGRGRHAGIGGRMPFVAPTVPKKTRAAQSVSEQPRQQIGKRRRA